MTHDRGLLSAREKSILQKYSNGATIDSIASQLELSPHTVRYNINQINEKLNTTNLAHAVATAMRLSLID